MSENHVLKEIWHIWESGGALMVPLFVLALFIYQNALKLLFALQNNVLLKCGMHHMQDSEIDLLCDDPQRNINLPFLHTGKDDKQIMRYFSHVRHTMLLPVNRRIKFLSTIITVAPLLGLLGTVTGMLAAFEGLVFSGDTFENITAGISEALITTQTGLVIAIPAMIILFLILEKKASLNAAITKLEGYHLRKQLKKKSIKTMPDTRFVISGYPVRHLQIV